VRATLVLRCLPWRAEALNLHITPHQIPIPKGEGTVHATLVLRCLPWRAEALNLHITPHQLPIPKGEGTACATLVLQCFWRSMPLFTPN
ncbi:hypothetical protein, partial [Serratia fonticola]|uniref:hypothetical protein n=1 Tax=Serratia fonticola TaxID=47917 RepID=UPI001F25F81F